jgi:hypothetical protein
MTVANSSLSTVPSQFCEGEQQQQRHHLLLARRPGGAADRMLQLIAQSQTIA